jgi:hypothetical protein
MTEWSGWWTTSNPAVGDGPVSFTQVDLAKIVRILAAGSSFEGVAPGYLNELAPTANGANTVAVNTGGAVVDGKAYLNDASVNVNVPSAVGAGNTRIDRIVLRVTWAGATQTTRITRIAGVDAASPSAPAMTQVSGTTYDLSLCTVLVNTGGTVTVTDARTFAKGGPNSLTSSAVTTVKLIAGAVTSAKLGTAAVVTVKLNDAAVTSAKIASGAVVLAKMAANSIDSTQYVDGSIDTEHLSAAVVTSAKIATGAVATIKLAADAVTSAKIADGAVVTARLGADSVTGTAAGNRIPQFHRREGGSATDWSVAGSTAYTPSAVRVQCGVGRSSAVGNVLSVSFPVAFSQPPVVLLTVKENSDACWAAHVKTVSASGFSAKTFTIGTEATSYVTDVFWLAAGPE